MIQTVTQTFTPLSRLPMGFPNSFSENARANTAIFIALEMVKIQRIIYLYLSSLPPGSNSVNTQLHYPQPIVFEAHKATRPVRWSRDQTSSSTFHVQYLRYSSKF